MPKLNCLQFFLLLSFSLVELSKYCHGNSVRNKRRAPVFVRNFYETEDEVDLTAEDFWLAVNYPVPDQPLIPSRVIRGNLVEGDIAGFTPETFRWFVEQSNHVFIAERQGRVHPSAIVDPQGRWQGGRIPYKISSRYTQDSRSKIAEVFNEFQSKTCLEFVPRQDEKDYVFIRPSEDPYICSSTIGVAGGRQLVTLSKKCFQKGTIIHELMHVLGFVHEHSRSDRDYYIKVIWENIRKDRQNNFDRYSIYKLDYLGTGYDYGSVMHYGRRFFSKNGKDTIVPLRSGVRIGQRWGFSETDIKRVNRLYQCS